MECAVSRRAFSSGRRCQKAGIVPAHKNDHGGIRHGTGCIGDGWNARHRRGDQQALKNAGYKVAANYGGNDEAAEKFKAETGIPVFKWDVGSSRPAPPGVKDVEAALGPVDVLVNNAGITRTPRCTR